MMRRVVLQRVRDAGRAAVAPGGVCGRGDEFDEGAVSGDVGMGGEWESREICDVEGESGGSVIELEARGIPLFVVFHSFCSMERKWDVQSIQARFDRC